MVKWILTKIVLPTAGSMERKHSISSFRKVQFFSVLLRDLQRFQESQPQYKWKPYSGKNDFSKYKAIYKRQWKFYKFRRIGGALGFNSESPAKVYFERNWSLSWLSLLMQSAYRTNIWVQRAKHRTPVTKQVPHIYIYIYMYGTNSCSTLVTCMLCDWNKQRDVITVDTDSNFQIHFLIYIHSFIFENDVYLRYDAICFSFIFCFWCEKAFIKYVKIITEI